MQCRGFVGAFDRIEYSYWFASMTHTAARTYLGLCIRNRRRDRALWRSAASTATALALHLFLSGAGAFAAEVNAIGASAPSGFAEIVSKVRQAVVGVRVTLDEQFLNDDTQRQQSQPLPVPPLEKYLKKFGSPLPQGSPPQSGVSLGSGFFISGDGFVVTNNHVVTGARSIEVTTDSGKTFPAKLVGTDPQTDLAVLKVSAPVDFTFVGFAAETPRIGDWVLPIGNPFGLGGTVTAGIVSARGRDIGEGPYDDFIQIDAPVNVGNSGGPTFDVRGQVVGVNTAIYSPSGGSVGIAFDIPAEAAKLVVQQLKDHGYVLRGWIGVQIQPITRSIAEAFGLRGVDGALVAQVEPGGPAEKGGLAIGDVIISVNGQATREIREVSRKIAALVPGAVAKFGVVRDGQEKTLTVLVSKLPPPSPASGAKAQQRPAEMPVLGLMFAPASAPSATFEHGAVIAEVDPTSPAAAEGLQAGDVIVEVGRHAVHNQNDVRKFVEEARAESKKLILLLVKRSNSAMFVAVPVS
jgi:serine protease Do